MTDYSKMSDFEINVQVSLELFEGSSGGDVSRVATWCACKENGEYGLFNPCNSWTDAGPIIQRNRISLIWVKTEIPNRWDAGSPCHMKWGTDKYNPLRAAMIVFLMMKEPENDS